MGGGSMTHSYFVQKDETERDFPGTIIRRK